MWAGRLYLFSFLIRHEGLNPWSGPGILIAYSVHFPPVFSLGLPCQQTGRTELKPLWKNLPLLLKWPALLICIAYDFFV